MVLAALDWAIIGAYFAVVILIGIVVTRKVDSAGELFLAGRSLGFAAVGLSLFASNISSTTIIGVSGAAYQDGISVAHYELMAALILVFMAVFTLPVFVRARMTTIPEYLERKFGTFASRYVSALTIFLSIFVDTAGSIYAGVLVLQILIPGLPFVPACIGFAVFAGLYTAAGGLRAVVYTDVLQAIVLLVGAAAISFEVFRQFDFQWAAVMASVPAEKLSMVRPLDDQALPWLGVIVGLPILGFYYWGTNQYVMQRVLGARSLDDARWGAMLAAALKLLPLFLFAIPGALAVALLPGLDNADQVFPTIITTYLPAGLVGLVLAGLIAAIMSTIDSALNSASTLVVYDFVKPKTDELSSRRVLRLGRLTTLGFVAIAAFWPLVIRDFPGLFNYIQQVFSLAVPPVAAVFLLALFWERLTKEGVIAALVFGHTLGAAVFLWRIWSNAHDLPDALPHFTILAGVTTLVCAAVAAAVSLARPAPSAAVDATLMWSRQDARPDDPRWDYRWPSAGIVVAVAALIWLFR